MNNAESNNSSKEGVRFQKLVQDALACGLDAEYLALAINRYPDSSGQETHLGITKEEVEQWASGTLVPEGVAREQALRFIRFQIGSPEGNIP